MCYFVVTTILVLAVQRASTQELGEIFNVTVEQELPEAFKYIVDTRNHTLQVRWVVPQFSYCSPYIIVLYKTKLSLCKRIA